MFMQFLSLKPYEFLFREGIKFINAKVIMEINSI